MKEISVIPYIYDIVVVLVISHNVFYCYKKGFVKSLISTISYIVGIIISHFCCRFLLKTILKSVIFSSIEDKIFKNFYVSDGLKKFFSDFGGSNRFEGDFSNFFLNKVLFIILFFSLFSFFRAIKRYIFKLTRKVRKFPIIGAVDGFLGAICGILKAFVFLFIFAIICFVVIVLTKNEFKFLNTNVVDSTYLFYMFYKITYFLK